MGKEFLTIHIGQAGVQSSHALWELVCMEHGISADGMLRTGQHDECFGEHIQAMYSEMKNGRYVPRSILLDLEPTVIDEVRTGVYRTLWNPSNLINQKEDAASNYARGYYTAGKTFIHITLERIQQEIEKCDNLNAFEIVRSYAGGTGSGFSSLMTEKLTELYGKKFKFSLGVFPSPRLSEIMVEPYNTILNTNSNINNEDCVITFDNESLFNKSVNKLKVQHPTFTLMNRIVAQMFSSISLSHRYRFFGSQRADVTELLTNLIPYPRIHFPVFSYAPLVTFEQQTHELYDVSKLTNDVFQSNNQMIEASTIGCKFMSCCMLYRGNVSPKPIIDAIARIKTCRDINFVDWCPTGFKIGINMCPPIQIPTCEQSITDNALCMVSGNTSIKKCWSLIVHKYDMLLAKRAFVHWYVLEGMEEGEFSESRDNIQSLILDYEELEIQDGEINTIPEPVLQEINDTSRNLNTNLNSQPNQLTSTKRAYNVNVSNNINKDTFLQMKENVSKLERLFGKNSSARSKSSSSKKSKSKVEIKCDFSKIQQILDKYQKDMDNNTKPIRNLTFSKKSQKQKIFDLSENETTESVSFISSEVLKRYDLTHLNSNNSMKKEKNSSTTNTCFETAKIRQSKEFFERKLEYNSTNLPLLPKECKTPLFTSSDISTITTEKKNASTYINNNTRKKQRVNNKRKLLEKSSLETVVCEPINM